MFTKFARNIPSRLKGVQQKLMHGSASSGYINIDGKNLFYEKNGSSPHSLLCMPGALGSGRSDFSYQLDELASDFTVVAFDPRGYGKSKDAGRVFDKAFFKTDAKDGAKIMRSLGFEKYSVLGWSDGGIAGLILAAANLDVENLVIWGANAFVAEGDKELLELTRDINNWSEKMRTPLEAVYGREGLQELWSNWMDGYCAFAENPNGSICIEELGNIRCPTLIVHGMKDALVPSFHAEFIKKHVKNSRLVTWPNGKHNLHMRYHEDFNKLVKEFILGNLGKSKLS